jgi:signal transduction histidine kinase
MNTIPRQDTNAEGPHDFNTNSSKSSEMAMFEDEILKLSARLRQSESGKSQFLSNVRNEINNPMASIIGLASSIMGLSTQDKVKRMSSLIQKQATQLDFQMRNIIMAAEIELGALSPSPSRVNVNSLVDDQLNYFNHEVTEENIEVSLRMVDRLRFQTDSQMLQSICLNLIANAIEFCGARRQIIIEAGMIDQHLEISVIDFGPGFNITRQAEIFQPFRQLDSGVCKKHKGHGLGLCIVNELVSKLQGTLVIDSETDLGTRVKLRLPELLSTMETPCSSNGNESLFTVDEEF